MNQRNHRSPARRWLAAFAFSAALAGPGARAHADEPDVLVLVVSPKSPLRDVSSSELRALFRDNGATIDGHRTKPINLPLRHGARSLFDDEVLDLSPAEAARYWADRQVRGRGFAPSERSNELQVQLTAYKLPNVIGYVRLRALRRGKLRVLTVDGKSHQAADYPLKEARNQK